MQTIASVARPPLSTSAMESTAQAVRAVRGLRTVAEIVNAAPQLIVAMGFDRVIISDAGNRVWLPFDIYMPRDASWGKDILEVARLNPRHVNTTLVENELIRTRRSIVVEDVQGHPRVNEPLANATRSDAYLAVPVVIGEEVSAFIHTDRYWGRGRIDARDATQIEVFADALGMALERAYLAERLADIAAGFELESGAARTGHECEVPQVKRVRCGHPALTNRENEIAYLIAEGLKNRQIAEELVLSEATVKSHVKHILRKLGAAHRAEAVSILLRAD